MDNFIHNPKSLYEVCILFVAKNISEVDSLRSFPSLIGEDIFKRCLNVGSLDENNEGTKCALEMFVREYSSDFISSLKCNSLTFLSEFQETFEVLLSPLRQLDLSRCQLGNSSSLLQNLQELKHLQILNLSQNSLSDEGFRKLTLRFKVFNRGFESLTDLDVSLNDMSVISLKSLLKIPNLAKIRVTLFSCKSEYIASHFKTKGFVLRSKNDDRIFESISNSGWGAQIMSQWERKMREFEELRKKRITNPPRLKEFYRFTRKFHLLNDSSKSFSARENLQEANTKLQTYTYVSVKYKYAEEDEENFCGPSDGAVRVELVGQKSKRPFLGSHEAEKQLKRVKTKEDHEAELFDLQLLNMYKS